MKDTIKIKKDVVIVGCGPAGLQLGYYYNINRIDYIILEQNDKSGSFFDKYPHSKELISINKIYTGKDDKDFNLRHDWNSLINNNEIEMKQFSEKYYPENNELVKYLNCFQKHHKINVLFRTKVDIIKRYLRGFRILCNNGVYEIECNRLVIATGLPQKNIPQNMFNIEKYSKHYSEYNKNHFTNLDSLEKYKNKNVLIVGNGNSGLELANILNNYCSSVLVFGRHTPIPSMVTHYVGDVRSKYIGFYDTFFLKSLNGLDEYKNQLMFIEKRGEKYFIHFMCNSCNESHRVYDVVFDEIINCSGWNMDTSIFDKDILPRVNTKYPVLNGKYESINVNEMYFIGSLMHNFDNKLSSGGFIHGFRYLIDKFVKINHTSFEKEVLINQNDLSNLILDRWNNSSELYQMFGQLADVFFKRYDQIYYYRGVPLSYLFSSNNNQIDITRDNLFVITLEYGESITDLKKLGQAFSGIGRENKSYLIHPVIRVFKNPRPNVQVFTPSYHTLNNYSGILEECHFEENIVAKFEHENIYRLKLLRFLDSWNILRN